MGQEIDGENMGDDYKGYVFKITGGNDAQGFPMKQGIMRNGRTRILFKKSKWTAPCSRLVALFVLSFLLYLIILNNLRPLL